MRNILTYPEHLINLKLVRSPDIELRGITWDDCDKCSGHEDKSG